jgi:subtilisin family serine protease
MRPAKYKIDARLRRRTAKKALARVREDVFIEVANAAAARWLEARPWTRRLVRVVDGYYTARIPRDRLKELEKHPGVIEVEGVRLLRPHLDHSVKRIHGREPLPGGGGVPDGRGVVIGFVDYGLDFKQKDFQNPRKGARDAHNPHGITRIAYLWDQQLKRKGNERAPKKYRYGVEYSAAQIDKALRAHRPDRIQHDPLSAEDIAGHGTSIAGIAAGNGQSTDRHYKKAGKYKGVAPAATLVFVSLSRARIIKQLNAPRGTFANSLNIAHGVAYCFEKADELGMPCVVNLSLGANGGGHDGDMALEWIIDALLERHGRAVVVAVGNEDGDEFPVHATGRLKKGAKAALKWVVGDPDTSTNDPNPNELEVWYPRGSAISARLIAPDGEASKAVTPGKSRSHTFANGEKVSIYSDPLTPWNGAARIHFELTGGATDIRFGTWRVQLQATRVGEPGGRVRFDAWIERTLPANAAVGSKSRFATYNPRTAINVTPPATSRRSITVASRANRRPPAPISTYSGRGPTRDRRRKPELTAPGDPIFSTNARARVGNLGPGGNPWTARRSVGGTSAAAPHVTGVIARMLGRNAYLTADEIRAILLKSATPPPHGRKWDPKWGYGTVNAARAVELVESLLGSAP